MQSLQTSIVDCPYCGESIEVVIDCSVDDQDYIEDCSVCCRPILFSVVSSDGKIESIETRTEDE